MLNLFTALTIKVGIIKQNYRIKFNCLKKFNSKTGHTREYKDFPVPIVIDGAESNRNLEAACRRGPTTYTTKFISLTTK